MMNNNEHTPQWNDTAPMNVSNLDHVFQIINIRLCDRNINTLSIGELRTEFNKAFDFLDPPTQARPIIVKRYDNPSHTNKSASLKPCRYCDSNKYCHKTNPEYNHK